MVWTNTDSIDRKLKAMCAKTALSDAVASVLDTSVRARASRDWRRSSVSNEVGRPLTLILRGGVRKLATLRTHFAHVAVLDTTPFSKTCRSQRAFVNREERLDWENGYETFKGKALDGLLAHNIEMSRRFILEPAAPRSHSGPELSTRNATKQGDAKSGQRSLSPGFELPRNKGRAAA